PKKHDATSTASSVGVAFRPFIPTRLLRPVLSLGYVSSKKTHSEPWTSYIFTSGWVGGVWLGPLSRPGMRSSAPSWTTLCSGAFLGFLPIFGCQSGCPPHWSRYWLRNWPMCRSKDDRGDLSE